MKSPDANDVLRQQGADAYRKAFDKASGQKLSKKSDDGSDIYSVDTLRTEKFPTLKRIAGDIIVEGLTLLASRPTR